ncbi:hypothetical protein ACN4EE_05820 [Geminocystis sp. CENA526]|uniref:hypothetical protein n=1 Tax=Geminocystis sp. CENA526 TaxID=1355871 RepID=UPI003D6FC001
MANLSPETITKIFELQISIWNIINETTSTEYCLLKQHGETEATISDLDMLQNTKEKTTTYYSRLYTLSLRIAETQPIASLAMIGLLEKTLNEAEGIIYASLATVQEIKKDWNLL